MALQQDVQSACGLSVQNAYFKVVSYSCNRNNIAHGIIKAYVSQALEKSGASHINGTVHDVEVQISYDDDAPNAKKQIYEYLKSTERYKDAVDC